MKVWPPGKEDRPVRPDDACRCEPASHDLAEWVLHDEKLLVRARFGGDTRLYNAWRDHLWTEMNDTMRRPDHLRHFTEDEEYVVEVVFDGDWDQYRVCRDRLREELWQIMKFTRRL